MGSYSKSQADIHTAGIALDRRVDKPFNPGERNYLIELPVNLRSRHAEDRAVEVYVLAARQFLVKAGTHLQQAADAPLDLGLAGRWRRYA